MVRYRYKKQNQDCNKTISSGKDKKFMCGIVGYVGKDKALSVLIQGLKRLEYRGYDSAGIAIRDINGKISICKAVGRVNDLEKKLRYDASGNLGIGHTRWATHGGVTVNNCHPHHVGKVTIVHNGILENYLELKTILCNEGYNFYGDTDTEVACAYIDYVYKNNSSSEIKDILEKCMNIFVGSYAIVGMIEDYDSELFVMKKDSPLIIALGDNGTYVASDISAYANDTKEYVPLEDMEYGTIMDNEIHIYKNNKELELLFNTLDVTNNEEGLQGFNHYMLKEIYEQKDLVSKWYNRYFNNHEIDSLVNMNDFKKIHIVGCGTAYHAGMVGKYLLEYYGDIEVQVFIASEYRYQKLFIDKDTLVIFISQSGETADTLACIKKVKEYGVMTLGIVNVENSSIARIVDKVIYTKALSEVAVASTKAYTAQVYVLSMLALKMALANDKLEIVDVKDFYLNLSNLIDKALNYDYKHIIDLIWKQEHMFYLGRNIDYVTMMEGSLKLKEISYIHSEAMAAGELKHGTISLMDEHSCILVMATLERLANKTISNIKEVKSRGAKVILLIREDISNNLDSDCYDEVILLPKGCYFTQPIINIVYLQMIAYEVAKRLGLDIDKPRNLAKSVTVE